MIAATKSVRYRAFTGIALAVAWTAMLYGVLEATSVGLKLVLAASLLPAALVIHFIARVVDEGFGCNVDFAALDRLVREFTTADLAAIRTADAHPPGPAGSGSGIHGMNARRAA